MSIRVVIVEDNAQLRDAFRALVDTAADLTCVGSHGTAEQALAALDREDPDVVLMDISLPGMSGIEAVRHVRERRPATQVVMLTAFDSPERVFESLRAGATGYVLKRAPSVQILDAIRDVHAGGAPMSGAVARLVVEHFAQHRPAPQIDALSERERAVLVALSEGLQYKEVAESLDVSLNTVRTYVRSIYDKLQVNNRIDAIRKLGRL
ncbi:MAG TPA: response regulator transcription factor [Vicinamibacterales bacterium]